VNEINAKIEAMAQSIMAGRSLFDHQRQACAALLSGRNVLLVAPMGSGKSLCYQLPAHLSKKPTLVVSPLIALMDDQAEKSRTLGLCSASLHSGINAAKQWWTISSWMAGKLRILYTSPERLNDERLRKCLRERHPGLVVIDEAHCISTWGSRFRPAYRSLSEVLKDFGKTPILAMTASAKPAVQADIVQTLNLHDPLSVIVPFTFANLSLSAALTRSVDDRLEFIRNLAVCEDRLPMVVFCVTKKQCDWVSSYLSQNRLRVITYHAGMTMSDRSNASAVFQQATRSILVATSAYEMGVDKSNIRTVVHFGLPSSLESYAQGIGRAGRDGTDAKAVLLYSEQDLDVLDAMAGPELDEGRLPCSKTSAAKEGYDFATTKTCRLSFLNAYFFPATHQRIRSVCGNCDNCHSCQRLAGSNPTQDLMFTAVAAALKNWRRTASRNLQQAAFRLLTDQEILRLSTARPQIAHDLDQLAGIRRSVSKNYGREILEVIRKNMGHHPT